MRNSFPLNSRTTAKETVSPSTLPSEIGPSPICPMVIVPVSLSPSTLKVKVFSIAPFGVSIDAFHVPEASAPKTASENIAIKTKIQRDFIVHAPRRSVSHFPGQGALIPHNVNKTLDSQRMVRNVRFTS